MGNTNTACSVMLKQIFRAMEMDVFRDMFMQKLQLSFLYVKECSQKHVAC